MSMLSPAYKKYRRLFIALCIFAVLWTAVIFSWSAAPADLSVKESSWVLVLTQKVVPSMTMNIVRKAAHFIEFLILGALLSAAV
ncbi:MAG: VanZ family protein, partial [Lachnospiraceae bacterium]|nr:VanZ family protein [Lachnospiraceae bacterium]